MEVALAYLEPFCPDKEACYITGVVILFSVLGKLLIPGEWVQGSLLKDGKSRVWYKLNGLYIILAAVAAAVATCNEFGVVKLYSAKIIYQHYTQLLGTLLILATAISVFLYLRCLLWLNKSQLNDHGGNIIEKFVAGLELNPHFFGFEFKEWSYVPGFILSTFINLSCLVQHYESNNNTVSVPMIAFQAMAAFYVIDAFWFERGMIYMFDMVEENFGFMLVFGDYFWIPWIFSVQSYCIAIQTTFEMSHAYLAINIVIFLIGYAIFRGANNQKIQFRIDPTLPINGSTPKVIKTNRQGRDLLISGWWGVARKINYLGDILIAVALAMPCNWSVLAYAYPIYLTLLLFHRAYRDDARCREKYGDYWKQYCQTVKYMIIPYVF